MSRQKSKKPLVAVNLSDIHCGSIFGLMPPSFESDAGNVVTHGNNHHQAWLWEKWEEFWREADAIIAGDPFALFLNGDMTEGVHHGTAEIVATKRREHFRIAEQVLSPKVKRAAVTYLSEGTECHTNDMEHDLCKVMSTITKEARSKWLVSMNGVIIDMTHHIGTTSRAYLEATAMSVTMGNAILNQVRAKHQTARVFLRGHRHCGGHFSDGHGTLAISPGWQFLTRHGRKVVPDSIPRPGGQILDFRNKAPGRLPAIHDIFYDPPQEDIYEA